MQHPRAAPTEADAATLVRNVLGESARDVVRFATGNAHHVYDVRTVGGAALVVRIGFGQPDLIAHAVAWSRRLRPLGVPLPRILHAQPDAPLPFMLLERLAGTDLGHVYSTLGHAQKRAIVEGVVRAQRIVGGLPPGGGYGFVGNPDGPYPHRTWTDLLRAELARSRGRIRRVGAIDTRAVDRVAALLPAFAPYLDAVPPRPFLDDTTTKNVIVSDGVLSGIVDVDCVCYGDPLYAVALTRMSLLNTGHDLDYIEEWCTMLAVTPEQAAVLDLYTAIFCVDFMAELGQQFNRDAAPAVARADVARLSALLDTLMRGLPD